MSSDAMGPPLATGAHVLTSQQFASGSVNATAVTQIGDLSASTSLEGGSYAVTANRIEAEASANRASNLVRSDASGAGLVSTQVNLAATTASATGGITYRIAAPGAIQDGSLSIDGNSFATSARGNAADNRLEFGSAASGGAVESIATRFDASAQGGAVLANAQSNYGRVVASAIDTSAGGAQRFRFHRIDHRPREQRRHGDGLWQYRFEQHRADRPSHGRRGRNRQSPDKQRHRHRQCHPGLGRRHGNIAAGDQSITGNQLSATAVGNQATSAIASPR